MTLISDLGRDDPVSQNRSGRATQMQSLGIKGVHITGRDTQAHRLPRPRGTFVNTWSVEGFISQGFQPAELG